MKIDRNNLSHWLYLLLFAANVALAIMARPFRRKRSRKSVVLYGHKLNGNLLAIYRELKASSDFDVIYLTMDPTYQRELEAAGFSSRLATSPTCVPALVSADAVVSDHGLHALLPMLFLSDLKFFDVWHGIPFKGFDGYDFRVQHRYDEVWVASPTLRALYVERFGFDPNIVHVTGYARTDRLVRRDGDPGDIKRKLGLEAVGTGKIVLFAPTWKQDADNRSLFPFGVDEAAFLGALSELGRRSGATFLVRAHLNSGTVTDRGFDHVVHLPYARFPDTEEILLISDILVCDWSSIAFDYLLLSRPTVFLDVPAPFQKGLTLDQKYRFGAIAPDMSALTSFLHRYLRDSNLYQQQFGARAQQVREDLYGGCADGHAAERCVRRLARALNYESSQ